MKNTQYAPSTDKFRYLKEFFSLTWSQLFLYLLISLLLLIFLNGRQIWQDFNSNVISGGNLGQIISNEVPWLHNFLKHITQGRALQVVFWVILGCSLYIFFWFIKNLMTNVRNDVIADQYIHPTNYDRGSYWRSLLVRKIFFWGTAIILMAYIYAATKVALALASISYTAVSGFKWGDTPLIVVGSLFIVTLLIYVMVILLRIVVNSWRFIYMDL